MRRFFSCVLTVLVLLPSSLVVAQVGDRDDARPLVAEALSTGSAAPLASLIGPGGVSVSQTQYDADEAMAALEPLLVAAAAYWNADRTPESQVAVFDGDDLVFDPNGYGLMFVFRRINGGLFLTAVYGGPGYSVERDITGEPVDLVPEGTTFYDDEEEVDTMLLEPEDELW